MTFPNPIFPRRCLMVTACAIAASLALPGGDALAQRSNDTRDANGTAQSKRADKDARKEWERTHRASKIIGTEVRNPQDQKVGEVKDLVLSDPASGTISHVVVAVGGVLGMGDKLFAVPLSEIRAVPGKEHLVLSSSSDLSKSFEDKNWPDQSAWQNGAQSDRTVRTPAAEAPRSASSPTPPATPSVAAPASASSPTTADTSAGRTPSTSLDMETSRGSALATPGTPSQPAAPQ